MIFLSDLHGNWGLIKNYCEQDKTICLGDVGIGFPNSPEFPDFGPNFKFIRGNHDNPEVCKKHPCYLGEYGYIVDEDLFFVSGANSIDQNQRTIGIDWWPDEQLSWDELSKCADHFEEDKPRIMVSHDCPLTIKKQLGINSFPSDRTSLILEAMFVAYQPLYWIFGHHHKNWREKISGTNFICVGEQQIYRI